jgi:putative ABC transport system permease protein
VVPFFLEERGTNNFDAIGRLREGRTIPGAQSEMLVISRRLEQAYPRTNRNKIVQPLAMLDFMVGGVRRAMLVLLAAVALVMLIACVNLASLLLARSAARQDEMAVRLAIGAGRGRVLRQWLTEGVVLALLGGGVGVAGAYLARDLIVAVAPASLPRVSEAAVDARVLGVGLLLSLFSGIAMSLLPALQTLRSDLASHLKGVGKGATGGGRQRWLAGLITTEVALAFLLLVGAGLLLKTYARLQSVALGFETSHVLFSELVLPESRYAKRAAQIAGLQRIVDRLSEIPGVLSAAYVTTPPLNPRGGIGGRFLIDGRVFEQNREPGARVRFVLGDYFHSIGLRVIAGRGFTPTDADGTELVAIVNRRFAREQLPGSSPLGRRVSFRDWNPERQVRWMTVVGWSRTSRAPCCARATRRRCTCRSRSGRRTGCAGARWSCAARPTRCRCCPTCGARCGPSIRRCRSRTCSRPSSCSATPRRRSASTPSRWRCSRWSRSASRSKASTASWRSWSSSGAARSACGWRSAQAPPTCFG